MLLERLLYLFYLRHLPLRLLKCHVKYNEASISFFSLEKKISVYSSLVVHGNEVKSLVNSCNLPPLLTGHRFNFNHSPLSFTFFTFQSKVRLKLLPQLDSLLEQHGQNRHAGEDDSNLPRPLQCRYEQIRRLAVLSFRRDPSRMPWSRVRTPASWDLTVSSSMRYNSCPARLLKTAAGIAMPQIWPRLRMKAHVAVLEAASFSVKPA